MDAETTLETGPLGAEGRKPARVVIADDHDLAREGLRDMLADEPGMQVVGEAADGREALVLCSRLHPDLVLMDVRMPEMDGLAATRAIKQEYPEISVLIITMHENPDYLLEAIKAGAAGYVLKDAPQHEVAAAVSQVLDGEYPLDPQLAARLLRRLATEVGSAREEDEGRGGAPHLDRRGGRRYVETLTPRELEVLGLLKLGYTNREIAQNLVIGVGTAKNHVEHIIRKLVVSDRTQAVVKALELGIIELS